MEFKRIPIEDLYSVIEIFHHENLKYPSGSYPEGSWITSFIQEGYAYGTYVNGEIKAALVAEPLLSGGVNLWLIATRQKDIGNGYGQFLMENFGSLIKELGKEWIFLTSWSKSSSFYLRNGFMTSGLEVKEYVKGLD